MAGYTVIDVETTGLSPAHHDRVVEIGVVYVSHGGEIQDHWSTLVNPQRDVGPTNIHGISASDVIDTPTFAELAPYLLRAISGRIMVAHNASFDLRFLAHEMRKAGVPLSDSPLSAVCTMQWSTAFLDAPSRRLVDCCRAGGVSLVDAHSAHGDAFATAQLLGHYLEASKWQPPWDETLSSSRAYAWPPYDGAYPEMRMVHRSEVRAIRDDSWLDGILSRMPRAADVRVDAYLAVLEMAMIDGFLAEHEKKELVAVATDSGLSRGQVLDLHSDYLRAMAEVALVDHVVTSGERDQLEAVAGMLGLRATDVDNALTEAAAPSGSHHQGKVSAVDRVTSSGLSLTVGDRIVFTGDMERERGVWEDLVRSHGLTTGGVSKKARLVVAGDPNSLSGKAAKARTYGLPIVTEEAFGQILAEFLERTNHV